MSRKVPAPRHQRPVHRSDAIERVVVGVALALLTAIVAAVVLDASLPLTIVVVAGVLVVAWLISQVL